MGGRDAGGYDSAPVPKGDPHETPARHRARRLRRHRTARPRPRPRAPKAPQSSAESCSRPRRPKTAFTFDRLFGPTTRVGWEIGDFLNSEFSFLYTHAFGTASEGSAVADVAVSTYTVGYRLTLDLFRKRGFTPFFGAGLNLGLTNVEAEARSHGATVNAARSGMLLEFHAVAGARYTTKSGLGFRAEGAYSTYGGFWGTWMPSIGVFYSFK
ncbi:MAG: hypothetical protein ACOX6T_18965 [Myxococcales bacterium]